jgi:putative transposase
LSGDRRSLIDPAEAHLSIGRQCQLAGIARSSFYYRAREEGPETAWLRRRIDQIYTDNPAYGSPRITAALRREGACINHKRVERLMRLMGLRAIYPPKRRAAEMPGHKIYPYLLGGLKIERVNQVWSTDITYVPTERGFVYLVAVLDWFSRYVLSWAISTTMEVGFCLDALERALTLGTPEIFNSDQGSQFTSDAFTGRVLQSGAALSMDSRGRAFDNIFIERLWRTVKYENVYPLGYGGARDAEIGLNAYLRYYDNDRLHSALDYRPPVEVYAAGGGRMPR